MSVRFVAANGTAVALAGALVPSHAPTREHPNRDGPNRRAPPTRGQATGDFDVPPEWAANSKPETRNLEPERRVGFPDEGGHPPRIIWSPNGTAVALAGALVTSHAPTREHPHRDGPNRRAPPTRRQAADDFDVPPEWAANSKPETRNPKLETRNCMSAPLHPTCCDDEGPRAAVTTAAFGGDDDRRRARIDRESYPDRA